MLSLLRRGDVSWGRGCCASLPYCLGCGLYGQYCGFWGGGVPVFLELLDDVSGHGDVEHSLFVILLESNPAAEIAVPINGEFIFILDARNEVVNIFPTFVFYTKIINDQREGDWPGCVFTKTWGLFALKVSVGGKALLE